MVRDPEEGADPGLPSNSVPNEKAGLKLPFPYHPLCFGAFAVLRLYAENLAVLPISTLWRPLAATEGLTVAVWLLAALILRDIRRGALIASVFVALFFVGAGMQARIGFVPMVLVFVLAVVLAGRRWKPAATEFFNTAGLILAVLVAIQTGYRLNRAYSALAQITRQAQVGQSSQAGPGPDIFYIILDGYGRSDALKHYIGLDNTPFIQGLEQRGFYVAKESHSNYSQTEQSLSSSLNMDYLSELMPPGTPNEVARRRFDTLIDQNRVAATLRRRGYRFVAITTGFEGVNPQSADVRYENNSSLTLFETTLLNETPIALSGVAESQQIQRYERLLSAFDSLERVAPHGPLPRFVFVHILAPHPPFVFNADGTMRPKAKGPFGLWDGNAYMRVGGTVEQYKEGYKGQAEYLDKRVLQAIDAILRAQRTPPVIIVQGDHGSKTKLDDTSLTNTDVREVFRNLNAYLVPPSVRQQLYPSITPVNSFRLLLHGLFGEPLEKLPDQSYYSTWDQPAEFADVTKRIEGPLLP